MNTAWGLAAVLALAAPAMGQAAAAGGDLRQQARVLEERVTLCTTLDALDLTPAQVEQLWPLVSGAAAMLRSLEESLTTIRAHQIEAFTAFRQEDLRGEGFTPEAERSTYLAERAEREARAAFRRSIAAVEKLALESLTEPQCLRLQVIAAKRGNLPQLLALEQPGRDPLPPAAAKVVSHLRRLSEAAFAEQRESLAAGLAEIMGWPMERPKERTAQLARLFAAMDEIRRLPGGKVVAESPAILRRARPLDDEEQARADLVRIHQEKDGAVLGAFGEFLAAAEALDVFARRYHLRFVRPAANASRPSAAEQEAAISHLRKEINLLNLANGLYFTPHQMLHLAAAAKAAAALAPTQEPDPDVLAQYTEALHGIWTAVEIGAAEPQKHRQTAARLYWEAHWPQNAKARSRSADLDRLAAEVAAVLSDPQKAVLFDYQACLIPPRSLKDPVRVGQANDRTGEVTLLRQLREIPRPAWHRERDVILDRILAEAEKRHGTIPEPERTSVREIVRDLVERARSLPDADFELDKQKLAEEFAVLNREERLRRRLQEDTAAAAVVARNIRAFLLDPEIPSLMAERLALVRAHAASRSVNLDGVNPAPSCRNGGCAVKE